jgi:hypothetical protein
MTARRDNKMIFLMNGLSSLNQWRHSTLDEFKPAGLRCHGNRSLIHRVVTDEELRLSAPSDGSVVIKARAFFIDWPPMLRHPIRPISVQSEPCHSRPAGGWSVLISEPEPRQAHVVVSLIAARHLQPTRPQ